MVGCQRCSNNHTCTHCFDGYSLDEGTHTCNSDRHSRTVLIVACSIFGGIAIVMIICVIKMCKAKRGIGKKVPTLIEGEEPEGDYGLD